MSFMLIVTLAVVCLFVNIVVIVIIAIIKIMVIVIFVSVLMLFKFYSVLNGFMHIVSCGLYCIDCLLQILYDYIVRLVFSE